MIEKESAPKNFVFALAVQYPVINVTTTPTKAVNKDIIIELSKYVNPFFENVFLK